ncbi:hypothetical protein K9L05_01770 [Candidatus Babeliales bacterium]|nr:hypothetical protein [Candidatus Babeliales bacterium]MCF7899355.1 hypothetical protein [Candidatus Babeliales bacterium]
MPVNKIILIFIILFYSSCNYIFSALPPKYLKEIKFEEAEISKRDTYRALRLLKEGTVIALRSRESGGYLFANDLYIDKQILSTVIKRADSLYVGYTYTTPDIARFVVVRKGDFIGLKSLFFEGNLLVNEKKFPEFKKTSISNPNAQWILECTFGLNQVFLRNYNTDTYLTVKNKNRLGKDRIREVSLEGVGYLGREQAFQLVILN